jgi:hypothetical protein
MGYVKYSPIVVVPAAGLAKFNEFMARNGYGDNFLVPNKRNAIIGASDNEKVKAATHYFFTCSADDGLIAAVKEALKKANKNLAESAKGLMRQRLKATATKQKVKTILENAGLKRKDKESADAEDAAEDAQAAAEEAKVKADKVKKKANKQ